MSQQVWTARQMQIMELLRTHQSLSIAELADRFDVSTMTIHRDLDRLAEDGQLHKVRGGAVPTTTATSPAKNARACAMCGKTTLSRTAWIVTPADGPQWYACCAHCGLLELQRINEPLSALATDFIYGRMVNVYQATYVIGSDINLCCSPSTLCFSTPGDAERFASAFGGQVHDFTSAMTTMTHLHGSHSHHPHDHLG
ncbi:MAG: DeoR family transcriptional regulator [Chloroflexota bacterium]